ncbi:MAG: hypothetical protein ABI672_12510 [Vicinamibacteria bacterium]
MATSRLKPFIDPVVSEPIDALEATRVFGGLLGQIILGGGSSGQAIDDGDDLNANPSPDDAGLDCSDSISPDACYSGYSA